MTLKGIIAKLFHSKRNLTVADLLTMADSTVSKRTIAGRTFVTLWMVSDIDNGFKTVKDGFKTKSEAKAFCETVSFNWYLTPYEIEM